MLNLVLAPAEGAAKMSDEQLINEAFTIIGAGYETSAYTLVFAWLALMQNRSVADRLYAEVAETLTERRLCLADVKALDYCHRVVKETLRLYPSAWGFSRSTLVDVEIGGAVLPRNRTVLVSPWTLGRDARWFADPERFDPDRFLPENARAIPHYAYIPFGGGARTCLGSHFALMEAVIIIAAIAQRYRLMPLPGSATGAKNVAFTLRPNGAMKVRLAPINRPRRDEARQTAAPRPLVHSAKHCPFAPDLAVTYA